MGFFDRLANKSSSTPPASGAKPNPEPTPEQPAPSTPAAAGGVKAQLATAREKLEARDLPAALAIYEELLVTAGDRPDVLVTMSGDLGSCGYIEQIAELVGPRYDADRHGPATGLNILQAYLATRNTTAAQHLLDILFGLQKPELEERLYGFSNALAELLEAERTGQAAPASPLNPHAGPASAQGNGQKTISLVSISRPIWAYGLENVPGALPPAKDGRLRRVAFGQVALLGTDDFVEKMKQPEDELGRFTRGLPLWLAETLYFSPHYSPIAAVGMVNKDHYAIFPSEWTAANIRQLVETSDSGLDYVFTGALKQSSGDYHLVLRLWEVKKFRERKAFEIRWTPATASNELLKLHEQVRLFMEWQAYPAGNGLVYTHPANPMEWCDTLGTSLGFFLSEKNVLPKEQVAAPAEALARLAARAATSEKDTLAWLTVNDRARKLGLAEGAPVDVALFSSPLVDATRQDLGG